MSVDLFQRQIGDILYNQLKKNDAQWHKKARDSLNEIYNQTKQYLDKDFPSKLPDACLQRLWELKLSIYLKSLKHGELEPLQKKYIVIPDFKLSIGGKSYFIEAICPLKGSTKNYPYLNTVLSDRPLTRDSTIGHREYRERLTSAFRTKALCKYDPGLCDSGICKHEHKNGYKNTIKDSGFIIAITMADIDFFNQPMNWQIALSCFFPHSPYMTMEIDPNGNINDTYHSYSPSFNKRNKGNSPINTEIFSSSKYSYVSAVLISHAWQVLFPDLSKTHSQMNFGPTDNDFMLIHNPFADHKIDTGLLPVEQEFITTQNNDSFKISLIPKNLDHST